MNAPTGLPPALAARQRRSVIDDATSGLGVSRGAHISIKGGRFRLVSAAGVESPIDTHFLDVVVVDAAKNPSRIYFGGPYVLGNDDPPVCFSDNGTGPSNQSMAPQAPTCAVCPHNIRGSDVTFSGKMTTACDNRKKIAVIIPDDPAVNVYEFQIPPGSLSNLKAYGAWIAQQSSGIPGRKMDIADFVTRVSFDPDKQFTLTFQPIAFADDDRTLQLLQYIDDNHLSDAAVGRNDVACDPEQVKQMLLGAPAARPALAAPPPAQQAPAQQFQMPQRQQAAAIEAPQAAPASPPAPRRRGRTAQAEAPASAATAPFMAPAVGAPTPSFAGASPAAAASQTAASPSNGQAYDDGIPAFLRRTADAPPAPSAPPRFGVAQAPPPPGPIQDALNQAMSLPTRRQ